ncbi:MAG: YhcH/YjgK/YiaL family protein, partial [Serratia liquefaciens]|nr:YhcH/YjgK/YiaL family protein [Serratia liquefaciens]
MIYNTLFNPRYGRGLSPILIETLTTLRQYDLVELAQGRHELKGEKIFMDVMTLTTGLAESKRAELHQEYAVIHLLLSG